MERLQAFAAGKAEPVLDSDGKPVRRKGGVTVRNPMTGDVAWESGTKKMRRSVFGAKGHLARAVEAPLAAAGAVVGAPFRGVGEGVTSALLGKKNTFGPYRGTRYQGVKGPVGSSDAWKEISPDDYAKRKAKGKGRTAAGKINSRSVFYRQKVRPGGLAGAVMKHPGKAAGAAALAYLLASSPTARSVGGALIPAGPKSGLSPEMKARLAEQVRAGNPLQGSAWG